MQELQDRYFELRKELFYAFDARISPELKNREIERWGNEIPGYDISQIEDYLDSVIERLDQHYASLIR